MKNSRNFSAHAPGIHSSQVRPENVTESLNASRHEALSQRRMSPAAHAYVSGAAGDKITMRDNRECWSRIRLNPNILKDVSEINLQTEILGQPLDIPILLAPAAINRLWHPRGEMANY